MALQRQCCFDLDKDLVTFLATFTSASEIVEFLEDNVHSMGDASDFADKLMAILHPASFSRPSNNTSSHGPSSRLHHQSAAASPPTTSAFSGPHQGGTGGGGRGGRGGKRKGGKGRQVDPAEVLGINVKSTRIMQGTIEYE
eukprot:Selendium_serpulae@DN3834_c0_g1_i2.p1